MDTPRRAAASIGGADENPVGLLDELVDDHRVRGGSDALVCDRHQFDPVALREELGDRGEDQLRVLLAVLEDADA